MPISIKTKLKSRKGASITFALLAFLVCAVIGTVVIAAASASGGRVKDLAEMDQRYYAVTSAAQLFRKELDQQTFTIQRVYKNTTATATPYQKNSSGDLEPGTSVQVRDENIFTIKIALPTDQATLVPVSATMTKDSLLTDAALHYVLGSWIENADWGTDAIQQKAYENSAPILPVWKLTVTASSSGSIDHLTVLVDGSMKADGSIELRFTNAVVDADDDTVSPADDPFTVILTLKASVQDNSSRPDSKTDTTSVVTPGSAGSYTETITRTTTKTKTTVITWTASEIKKVS